MSQNDVPIYQIEKWQASPNEYPTVYEFVEIVGYDLTFSVVIDWLYTLRDSEYQPDNPQYKYKFRLQPEIIAGEYKNDQQRS